MFRRTAHPPSSCRFAKACPPRPATGWPRLALVALLAGCSNSQTVTRLDDGVTVHTFRRAYTNAHLVRRGDVAFLVDSGLEGEAPALEDELRAIGVDPATLKAVVLTHGHADHAGGAGLLHQKYGVPVVVGAADQSLLASGRNEALCPTDDAARERLKQDQAETYRPYQPQVLIDSEQSLESLVELPARVVPMPGHTPGSQVVLLGTAAFVGDLFRSEVLSDAAAVHFYMCDLDANQRDIRRLLDEAAPEVTTYFTGHFGPVSRAAVKARFAK